MSQATGKLLRGGLRYSAHPELSKFIDPAENRLTRQLLRVCPFYQRMPLIKLPKQLETSAINVLRESRLSPGDLRVRSNILLKYLWTRELPLEYQMRKDLFTKLLGKNLEAEDEDSLNYGLSLKDSQKQKLMKGVRMEVKDKKFLSYHGDICHIYLVARLTSNYATAYRVLNEIKTRCPNFHARNIFDFGSGLASASWAAHYLYPATLTEYMMVDSSSDMNNIADLLLRGGYSNREYLFRGSVINHRQFLPASPEPSYDLVVAAHSLLDVGFQEERDRVVSTLWNKTDKFLVIIEQATKAGFNAVLRARDCILNQNVESDESMPYIFAPCPHKFECGKKDNICSFNIKYNKLNLTSPSFVSCNEVYSYLIVSKGPWPDYSEETAQLPRIVSYKISKKVHSEYQIHDLCTASGHVERNIFSKSKTDKFLFQYVKKCKAGDILPAVSTNQNDVTDEISESDSESE